MKSLLPNRGLSVVAGIINGLLAGALAGFFLGELGGYLSIMVRWMNTHEYQIARQIHGGLIALVLPSGIALDRALLLAAFTAGIGAIAGLINGLGIAIVGIRNRSGFEWFLVNIIAAVPILFVLGNFINWIYFILAVSPGVACWPVILVVRRTLGPWLPGGPIRGRMWIGYLVVTVLITVVTYMLVMLFVLITRV
jgi:hypothetical protein